MSRIFDCFPFYNELDLLEIRLNELSGVVHRFVLAESSSTYSGNTKKLIFENNRQRFAKFADQIIHIVVDDADESGLSAWQRRANQCNALAQGLADAAPDDLILFSDVDEIPRANVLKQTLSKPPGRYEIYCFELRMYNYFMNLQSEEHWLRSGPRMVQKQYLGEMESLRKVKGTTTGFLRDLARGFQAWRQLGHPVRRITLPDAGWHFTYLGGVKAIQQKVRSFAGHDKVTAEISDSAKLVQRIRDGYSADTRKNTRIFFRPLDDSFPRYLLENRDRFSNLILESPEDLHKKLA